MTSQEQCEKELREYREACEEFDHWKNKAAPLPPSITPIEEGVTIHSLSDEEIYETTHAMAKEKKAWQRVLKANEAVIDCQQRHQK